MFNIHFSAIGTLAHLRGTTVCDAALESALESTLESFLESVLERALESVLKNKIDLAIRNPNLFTFLQLWP